MRGALLALRAALIFVFFTILFWWLQPFSQRHEGLTARDWYNEWMISPRYRSNVIDAFGTNAVPMLAANCRLSPFWRSMNSVCPPTAVDRLFVFLHQDRKHQVARDWLAILHHRGFEVLPQLIKIGDTNTILSILCYHQTNDLARFTTEGTDAILRIQAERASAAIQKFGFTGGVERLLWTEPTHSSTRLRVR